MNVGYIGLGARGAAFAYRLASSYPIQVYDADRACMQAFDVTKATQAVDLRSLASASDVILLSLVDQDEVEDTLFGPMGLAQGLKPGTLVIDQTTGDPSRTRALAARLAAEHGITLVDAPTSAQPDEIAAGTACLMCGGSNASIEAARPILTTLSENIVYCGEAGNGHAAALVSHAAALCNRLITYEGATLAVKYGLSLDATSAVINKSGAWNGASERVLPILGSGGDTLCQPVAQSKKDLHAAIHAAVGCGVPMFIANTVHSLLEMANNEAEPAAGVDEIARLFEKMARTRFAGA
ncbi:NAD(P)-dependent oxidoreductase [Paraburkholderia kirstenboschensis]|uniref:NAD(P)-binding domain-containing protein n=1 Tax=Paraburkholderia kirstenboschensis TaxID=1245436 RepID=A0ABZ0EA57_9BURK|nr:NAD(P)-binding domain-containing protein [Paraburkholderia kirstenboschensis]WOD14101.1 NAD(P)-binding domain-containing protein [Paraburkholderia kirstenboschensis]